MARVQFSFQRTENGWGIKASGNIGQATRLSGTVAEVRRADGTTKLIELGDCLAVWNAGRSAVYAIGREVKR